MVSDLLDAGSGEDDGDRGGGDGRPRLRAAMPARFRDDAANDDGNNDATATDGNIEDDNDDLPPGGHENAERPSKTILEQRIAAAEFFNPRLN